MADVKQAGAVAVRRGGQHEPLFLVVTAKRNPDHWIFPKGHVEPGESAKRAAVRELQEEAGVSGAVGDELGSNVFNFGGKTIAVRYFLVRADAEQPADEGRNRAWLNYADARARLTFPDAKRILDRAAASLDPPRSPG